VCGLHPNVSCVNVVVVHKKCKYHFSLNSNRMITVFNNYNNYAHTNNNHTKQKQIPKNNKQVMGMKIYLITAFPFAFSLLATKRGRW
jgi:hypothetical protein